MDSLTFLDRPDAPEAFYVLSGDEEFLKRQVLLALRQRVADGNELGVTTFPGDRATWADVNDELGTFALFGGRRLVVVEGADPFVTKHRAILEKYVGQPSKAGVLALDVKSFPANTRLAKMVKDAGSVVCKAPPTARLPEWCAKWSAARHGKTLSTTAARLLVDLVGAEMGLLDQEIAKLAAAVGGGKIDQGDVDRLVGSSRAETTWKIFDVLAEGRLGEALTLLDRLFDQGEDPMRLLGAFSMTLRRLAMAGRLASADGEPLTSALERAGVPPFAVAGAERQLRWLGAKRAGRLYEWLIDVDQGLKGGSQLPPRLQIERLVVRLGRRA